LLGDEANEHRVNEVVAHIEETTYVDPEKFYPPANLICVENGVLDISEFLKTGRLEDVKLTPHAPDVIFLHKIPAPFDPKAKCPKVGKFFTDWMDLASIIRAVEMAGYCLYRLNPIGKAIICVGEGGNGKTTFVLFLRRWLGERNVASTPVQEFGTVRFATATLLGKLANLVDDLPPTAWFSTGLFKQLTGGSPVQVEFKFKNPFDAILYAKQLYTANRLPMVSEDTRAFWERVLLISFPNVFEGEKRMDREKILAEMLTPEERSGFLNAALLGLYLLLKDQDFYAPEDINLIRDRYIRLSDPVAAFVEDRTVEDPEAYEQSSELYRAYVKYCKEKGFAPTLNNIFSRLLKKVVPSIRAGQIRLDDGSRPRVWYGIRLKTQEEIKADEEAQKVILESPKASTVSIVSAENPSIFSILKILCVEKIERKTVDAVDTVDRTPEKLPATPAEVGGKAEVGTLDSEPSILATSIEERNDRLFSVEFEGDYPGGLIPGLRKPIPKGTIIVLPAAQALELGRKFGFVKLKELGGEEG
jgi:putative DNA primase/helicase